MIEFLRKKFGIVKPSAALKWDEWDDWEKQTRAEHPIGFFLTETAPTSLSYWYRRCGEPLHIFKRADYYWRNRFLRQTHVLPTRFKPGDYYDLRSRLLHGMMEALVDFVEIEKAHIKARRRDPESGLKYLQWEATLDSPELPEHQRSPEQAATAREIIRLYHWWKDERPKRPDPYDVVGWDKWLDKLREKYGEPYYRSPRRDPDDNEHTSNLIREIRALEDQYWDEDQENLHSLIKQRGHLWT